MGMMASDQKRDHVKNLIPDYLLGLLSPEVSNLVIDHVSHCSECQQAITNERQEIIEYRRTLSKISQIDDQRLMNFYPALIAKTKHAHQINRLSRDLSLVLVLVVLVIGSLGLRMMQHQGDLFNHASTLSSTISFSTETPTATISQVTDDPKPGLYASPTPVAQKSSQMAEPSIIPIPVPKTLN